MKTILTLALVIMATMLSAQNYYSVRSNDATSKNLETINAQTGIVSQSTMVNLAGATIDGYTGMAYNPADNQIYAVLRASGQFKLVTIRPSDGLATLVANLNEKFAGIAFNSSGVLYGLSGDGGNVASSLFTINTSTGAATLLISLEGVDDGEALAFNSDNGLLYRYGGGGFFQTIDPSNLDTMMISSYPYIENYAHSLCYDPTTSQFIFTAADSLYSLTSAGVLTPLSEGNGDDGIKGMVPVSVVSSVAEFSHDSPTMRIGPNPSSDFITIRLSDDAAHTEVSIFDISGRLVSTYSVMDGNDIDIRALAPGRYILKASVEGMSISTSFIKD